MEYTYTLHKLPVRPFGAIIKTENVYSIHQCRIRFYVQESAPNLGLQTVPYIKFCKPDAGRADLHAKQGRFPTFPTHLSRNHEFIDKALNRNGPMWGGKWGRNTIFVLRRIVRFKFSQFSCSKITIDRI